MDLDSPVPSKRVGYKRENGILVANVPSGVDEFEAEVKRCFAEDPYEGWPLKVRLLMGIKIYLPKSRYLSTDVDNMTKTIMDAFCGIAYEDDKQIDSLFVAKAGNAQASLILNEILPHLRIAGFSVNG